MYMCDLRQARMSVRAAWGEMVGSHAFIEELMRETHPEVRAPSTRIVSVSLSSSRYLFQDIYRQR
jgi:hypothetical protein